MNKFMENLKATVSALVLMIFIFSVQGCNYTEGDDKADLSFNLMTSQEKAMHDKALEQFGEKRLMSVRTAVGKRTVKPNENSLPFMDIANVIKHCDETILVPSDARNDTDGQERARRVKFSSQDFEWYKKIVKKVTGEDYVAPEKPVASKPISEDEVKDNFVKRLELAKKDEERVEINPEDLLPLDKYQDVKFLARGCEQAISIIESAAGQDRPLTEEDFKNIQYEKAVCETKKLNENL